MNNLRHPFRAAALAALLCLALAPPTALAQFSYNGNNYTTLHAAFTAMSGASGTIYVTNDTGTAGTSYPGYTIANGQTLTLQSDTPGTQRTISMALVGFKIEDGGTLTVKDIIFDYKGASYVYWLVSNASTNTLTLDHCVVKNFRVDDFAPIRSFTDLTISCPNSLVCDSITENILSPSNDQGGFIYSEGATTIDGEITCSNLFHNAPASQFLFRMFYGSAVYSLGALTFKGKAVFNNCRTNISGAVYAKAGVTFEDDCTFTRCYCIHASKGGGIYAEGGVTINGNANFTDCGFLSSDASLELKERYMQGGGIYCKSGNVSIAGTATFDGCDIQGYPVNQPINGGGIYTDAGNVSITGDAIFTDNKAGNGGGIYANGNVVIGGDARFEGNRAGGNNAGTTTPQTGPGNGGGIYAIGSITISGTGGATFTDCQAFAGILNAKGRGGAIYSEGNISIPYGTTFTECRANDADAHAGGICFGGNTNKVVTGNMVFTDCYSAGKGGGMSLLSGELTINGNVTGNGCTANNGSGGCVFTDAPMTINGTVNIDDCESTQYHGGGLAALHGTVTANGTVTITNCTAKQNGGGIYAESAVTLNALGNTITGNTATDGNGGGIFCTGGLIKNTTLGGNAANKNTAGNNGGGIFNNGGTLAFESNQNHVTHNAATNNGGGIYNNNGGTINFNADPNVSDNQADNDGGGIYNATGGTLNFNAPMDINNNTATGNGGGVFNDGTFNSIGTTALSIEGNQANNGGGIYNTSVLAMTSSGTQTIARNTATNNGGGLWTNGMSGTLIPVEVEETVYGVEYIEVQTEQISAGIPSSVAYINTGITFSGDHKTWARGQRAGGELFMFYAYTSNNERAGYKVLSANIQRVWPDVTNSGQSYQGTIASLINDPIEVEQDASHITITVSDGTSNTFNYSGNTSGTVSNTWTLLRPYAINSACKGRLFEAKIWDGSGTLIGHYIPCRRASGEVGVYDAVTRKFLGNAGSAGSFTAGNDNGQTHTAIVTAYAPMNVVTLNNITIGGSAADKNTATNGAGIYVEGNGITLGNNCTVSYNEASNNGGGVYNNTSATVAFIGTDTNIDYNKASNNGGGLYNTSTLEYDNDNAGFTAQHNSANDGGGVYADGQGNTTLLQNAIVKNNTATRNGGGGYVNTNAIIQLDGFSTTGVLFQQNHAGTHGGGIYKLGTLKVQGLIDITENTAGQ